MARGEFGSLVSRTSLEGGDTERVWLLFHGRICGARWRWVFHSESFSITILTPRDKRFLGTMCMNFIALRSESAPLKLRSRKDDAVPQVVNIP